MGELKKVSQGKLTFYYGIEQGTQEWLELRADKVTCSNADVLCSHGKSFAKEVNRQHALRATPNGNRYAERGHVLEAEVMGLLEGQFNNEHYELMTCSFITNSDYPDAGYSPDGVIMDKETGKFIMPVEIKCFNDTVVTWDKEERQLVNNYKWKHADCCANIMNVPIENRLQFEMEMLITETKQLLVVLYNPDADTAKGIPVLKTHVYTPELLKGKECYQERIKAQLAL